MATTLFFSRVARILCERQWQNHTVGLRRYCYALCSANVF